MKKPRIREAHWSSQTPQLAAGRFETPSPDPFHKAVLALRTFPHPLPRIVGCSEVPRLTPAPHHPRLMCFLRIAFAAILGRRTESQLGVPCQLWKRPRGPTSFVAESGERAVVSPRAHYQAGVTECGCLRLIPCLMGQKWAPTALVFRRLVRGPARFINLSI